MRNRSLVVVSLFALVISSIMAAIVLPQKVSGTTYVGGDIWTDTTWTLAGSPWIVVSPVTIHNGATLTIEAGVQVKFNWDASLSVEGNLFAPGTAVSRISFSGNLSMQWQGMRVLNSGHASINNATFDLLDLFSVLDFEGVDGSHVLDTSVNASYHCLTASNSNNITIAGMTCFSGTPPGVSLGGKYNKLLRSDIRTDQAYPSIQLVDSQWSMISGNYISALPGGTSAVIDVSGSRNNTIANNSLEPFTSSPQERLIRLKDSSDNQIAGNRFTMHWSGSFVGLDNSSGNRFVSNTFNRPSQSADVAFNNSSFNRFDNNTFAVGAFGDTPPISLLFSDSSLNGYQNNSFDVQVSFSFTGGSPGNTFLRNDFRAPLTSRNASGTAILSDSCSGNRWFGYKGGDWNRDGIGDTPFGLSPILWDMKPIIVWGSCFSPKEPAPRIPPGITRVTDNPATQVDPLLYGNIVAWKDYRGASPGVYYYDFEDRQTHMLPVTVAALADLYKDRMVYMTNNQTKEYQIWLNRTVTWSPTGRVQKPVVDFAEVSDLYSVWGEHDFTFDLNWFFGVEVAPTETAYELWGGHEVELDNSRLAMVKYTGQFTNPAKCHELFLRFLPSGPERQITKNYEWMGDPCPPFDLIFSLSSVSMSGDRLVWSMTPGDFSSGFPVFEDTDVYMHAIATNATTLLRGAPWNETFPQVYADTLVYTDDSRKDWDLVVYNISTGKEVRLRREGDQLHPSLYRNSVAWHDNIDGQWEIYVANLSFFVGDVDAIPNPQDIMQDVTIRSTIVNARPTSNVFVEVRKPTGEMLVNATMINDGGGKYHYTSAYTQVGKYCFKVSAVDDYGSWASENGTFAIRDISGPSISSYGANPPVQEAPGSVNVSAMVTDPSGMTEVWLRIVDPSSGVTNTTMVAGPGSMYYVNTTYSQLGTHTYTISARDTLDNWNSVFGTFIIIDSILPEISSVTVEPNPQQIHMTVNVSARVIDNLQVANVMLQVTGPGLNANWSMFEGQNDIWFHNRSYSSLGPYNFIIFAADLAGNFREASGSFSVIDSQPPVIFSLDVQPNPARVFVQVEILATITDNDNVSDALADVTLPDGSSTSVSMTKIGGDSYRAYYTPSMIGRHNVTLRAWDPSMNEMNSTMEFTVIDDVPPNVISAVAEPDTQEVFGLVNVTAMASDNYMLAAAYLNVTDPDGIWTNVTMSLVGAGAYYLYGSYDKLGTYRFVVSARDSSDLWGRRAGIFVIVDTTQPVAIAGGDQIVTEGTTVEFDASLSHDNYRIAEYRWSFDYSGVPVTLLGNVTVWPFGIPGAYTVRLSVADTSGNVGTDDIVVTVLPESHPPQITSVTVSPSSPEYLQIATFIAHVTGASVDEIWLEVWNPDGASLFNRTMSWDSVSGVATLSSSFNSLGQFRYRLSAVETAGLWDAVEGSFEVIDSALPHADAGPDRTAERGRIIEMNASASTDNVGIIGYVWRWLVNGTEHSSVGPVVEMVFGRPGIYDINLTVEDSSNNVGSTVVRVTVVDTIAPDPPSGLQAYVVDSGALLTWAPNTEDDLAGYDIYRAAGNGLPQLVASVNASQTRYFDSGVVGDVTYIYTLRALDLYGHQSAPSEGMSVKAGMATSITDGLWLVLLAVVILVAVLLFLHLRRRGREPQPKEAEAAAEEEEETTETSEPQESEQSETYDSTRFGVSIVGLLPRACCSQISTR